MASKNKHIPSDYQHVEPEHCLSHELSMQQVLRGLKDIRSAIPNPIGVGYDSELRRHYSAFEAPDGYYTYLSDISDNESFINAACIAAHDLGYLLCRGYVFQNLISVFHGEGRSYTLLPSVIGVENGNFAGFPGRLDGVAGLDLYENIGQSGLRDLGDIEHIEDFQFDNMHGRSTKQSASTSLKFAHFVSLYLMIFTVLMGNRSRKLQKDNPNEDYWSCNSEFYSKIIHALFEGLGIKLSDEERSYIDPLHIKPTKKASGETRAKQPSEKFNDQLEAWFTTKVSVLDTEPTAASEKELQSVYGTKKVTYAQLTYDRFDPEEEYPNGFRTGFSQRKSGYFQTRERLWRFYPGALGQDPSGILPIVTPVKYFMRAAQIATKDPMPSASLLRNDSSPALFAHTNKSQRENSNKQVDSEQQQPRSNDNKTIGGSLSSPLLEPDKKQNEDNKGCPPQCLIM